MISITTIKGRLKMMILNIKKFVIIILIIPVFITNAHDQEYCLQLQTLISYESVQQKLLDWVDKEFDDSLITIREVTSYYSGIRPGKYTYKKHDFNWKLLNFDIYESHIKLMGLEIDNFYEDYTAPSAQNKLIKELRKPANRSDIDSIFFSEKSYYGILIKQKSSNKFIDDKYNNYLHVISDRIGVLCGRPPRNNRNTSL